MTAHVRPLFNQEDEFVALVPIYRGARGKVIKPGDSVSELESSTYLHLFLTQQIGPKGDPWTDSMVRIGKASYNRKKKGVK